MAGGGTDGVAFYDAALGRRQKLMGASGARALWKNFKVFRIAAFACIGGVLYGYNQGMFASVLSMNSFKSRKYNQRSIFFFSMERLESDLAVSPRHGRI